MTLWLVRHARPLVAPGVCYGRLECEADAAMTDAAAERLRAAWIPGAAVWTSPARRCRQLADALVIHGGAVARVDPRLAEMDFGTWEGRPWSAIDATELQAWTDDFAHHRPGGTGETATEVMARVAQAWDECRAAARPTLWITHAGVIRAALLLARGRRRPGTAADWPSDAIPFGSIHAFSLDAT